MLRTFGRHCPGPCPNLPCGFFFFFAKSTVTAFSSCSGNGGGFKEGGFTEWPPAVESSIAVKDAVANCGLYRIFVSGLF